MIASSWTLLSILTAVVSENMISTTSMQEEDFRGSRLSDTNYLSSTGIFKRVE